MVRTMKHEIPTRRISLIIKYRYVGENNTNQSGGRSVTTE